jgi:putative hydrolase of the HAD superfamily
VRNALKTEHTKVLLWDFDQTLAHREGRWSGAVLEVVRQNRGDDVPTLEAVRALLRQGFPWHQPDVAHDHIKSADAWWSELISPVLNNVFLTLNFDSSQLQSLVAQFRQNYLNPNCWKVYPDVVLTLETLAHEGWQHVVLSNHIPELEALMAALSLEQHFEAVFSSGVIGFEKPNRRFFEFALEKIGPVKEIWMIGDNYEHDILGAAQLGIPGILVRQNHADAKRSCLELSGVVDILHTRGT